MPDLAETLTSAGIGYANVVLAECERNNIPIAPICVLLVKETGGGANVYGHDADACMTVPGIRVQVTAENYREYQACVAAGGKRNGIGPLQLTYWSLQDEADRRGGCHLPEISIQVGAEHFAGLYRTGPDLWTAFRRWNGTGERSEAYADDAMARMPWWTQLVEGPPMSYMPGCDRSVPATDTNSTRLLTRCDGIILHTIGGGPGPADKATWSVRRDGYTWQHRGDDRWTAANLDGNPYYLAIENADRGPGWSAWPLDRPDLIPPMTPEQCEANARILAYVHKAKGVPLVLMPDSLPGRRGVGYHRLGIDGNFGPYDFPGRVPGGVKYSSVFGKLCPVDVRIHQLIDIILPRARALVGLQQPTQPEVTVTTPQQVWDYRLPNPVNGHVDPAGYWLCGANDWAYLAQVKATALGPPIARIEAKVDQLLEAIKVASEQAAREGAKEGATAEVLARLDRLHAELNADDPEQAREGARQVLAQILELSVRSEPQPS